MRERGRSAIQIGSPRTIAACSALGSWVVSIVYGPAVWPAVARQVSSSGRSTVAHRDLHPVRVGEHLHAARRGGQHALDVRRRRQRARELAAPLGGEQPALVLAAQQVGGDRVGERRVPPPQRAEAPRAERVRAPRYQHQQRRDALPADGQHRGRPVAALGRRAAPDVVRRRVRLVGERPADQRAGERVRRGDARRDAGPGRGLAHVGDDLGQRRRDVVSDRERGRDDVALDELGEGRLDGRRAGRSGDRGAEARRQRDARDVRRADRREQGDGHPDDERGDLLARCRVIGRQHRRRGDDVGHEGRQPRRPGEEGRREQQRDAEERQQRALGSRPERRARREHRDDRDRQRRSRERVPREPAHQPSDDGPAPRAVGGDEADRAHCSEHGTRGANGAARRREDPATSGQGVIGLPRNATAS